MDERLLNSVNEIAQQAGAAIMAIYRNPQEIAETGKADGSPLTQADLAAQRIIVAGLHLLTPDMPMLSEEAANIPYAERALWRRYWLVDPLDGTKEFIKRNGEFTVNIALIQDGIPILGVVYAPALDLSYYAARNHGAYLQRGNNPPVPISAKAHSAFTPIKVVASRSHRDVRTNELLSRLGAHQCISMGSSLKLCLVAEGAADFYPRLGPTMEWDTAAAHAVVHAAGGCVCDVQGRELQYNKTDLHNPEFLVFSRDNKTLCSQLGIPVHY